ncbi:UDP-glucose/GDP-mannose dehydrogenase family protein [Candidatus Nomurabacteria bacterium]|nr:UDP-glucose/GDP-mannose dehydrogenase family protein [Candidatus Nomurabacteria bacterium]
MKIAVVGTGYVGLVTGTCFAEMGNDVTCVDIDESKIRSMQEGIIPIYEPDLDVIFKHNIKEGRLSFTTRLEEGIEDAEIIFLALPTPPGEDGSADLSYILNVSKDLGPLLKKYAVIVDKSTVPVGTSEKVKDELAKTAKVNFDVVSNPEFLREGFAVADFMKPDRIVVGTSSKKAEEVMKNLYEPFVVQGAKLFVMDSRSAEMTKYAANSFLATKISFMNEVANLCELTGADVDAVRLGVGSDARIGDRFLYPGIGYGGSCFPKDVKALVKTAKDHDYDFQILGAVEKVNDNQKLKLVVKIQNYYKNDLKGKKFALWGLAFKPDTDDIREAPALEIIRQLIESGASVVAYDPEAVPNTKKYFGVKAGLDFVEDEYEALSNADALVIATEWSQFRAPDFVLIKSKLKSATIFDGRNLYNPAVMEDKGFHYESIGRATV